MNLYAKYVLPWLIDLAMKNREATRLRAIWVPRARGSVLEVGVGSGLNLTYYSQAVEHIYGVDPSDELQQIARKRATGAFPAIEFLSQSAEDPLPLSNSCIDTVVMTWTLCSIPNAPRALAEIKRVLRPEGRLIFVEHGRAPDQDVSSWQDRLTPFWKRFTGGCHLNRRIDELLTATGFQIAELRKSYLPGPRPMTYTYQGIARLTDNANDERAR